MLRFSDVRIPTRFRVLHRDYRGRDVRILDVGCGNHSAALAHRWFPSAEYHGLDCGTYNNDPADFRLMECFYDLDLERDDLSSVPDDKFDLVIFAHVLEHLHRGEDVLCRLAAKLAPRGRIYVETPTRRSRHLPRARGTLRFDDDPTHVRLYPRAVVAQVLEEAGLRVLQQGIARDPARVALAACSTPYQAYSWLRYGKLSARFGMWDLTGFASYTYAEKP